MNLSSRSRLSLNLNLGPRPSHRPSRASCPLMNFSAFLSWTRPRQRLSWANVTADSARLTIIARVVASNANRSVLNLSMESSFFEFAGLCEADGEGSQPSQSILRSEERRVGKEWRDSA